jgi:hypothetical protein
MTLTLLIQSVFATNFFQKNIFNIYFALICPSNPTFDRLYWIFYPYPQIFRSGNDFGIGGPVSHDPDPILGSGPEIDNCPGSTRVSIFHPESDCFFREIFGPDFFLAC